MWCITGGSPCQDLSIAGKRAGLAGARSGLFMEQVRIVKEMREADKRNGRTGDMVRPRYLVWENVVGAFSSNKGKDFAAVLEEIIKIVEPEAPSIEVPEKGWPTWGGYHDEVGGRWSVVWRTHDAQYWGVPQRRRRISVVADFGGDTASEIQFDRKSVSGDIAESGAPGERPTEAAERGFNPAVARSLTARADGSPCADRGHNIVCSPHPGGCDGGGKGALVQTERSGTLGTGNDQTIFAPTAYSFDSLASNSMKSKNPHSGCREVDVAKTLDTTDPTPSKNQGGIAVVAPAVALDMTHACDVIRECGEQVPALQARMGTGGNQVPLTYGIGNGQACEASIMAEEMAQTLNTMHDAQAVLTYQDVTGTLSPGAHAGSYNGQDAYNDMLVCGASPDVAHALRAKANCAYREDAETYICGAVDCRNGQESDVGWALQARTGHTLNANGVVRSNMVVRRLTPMECERLQGFPDGWTDIGDWVKTDKRGREIKVKGSADSPRYKALGNSIALPFWDWMLRRMARYLPGGATLGSLFDGISGFNVCWARIHGAECCRWSSEIEQFPIAVVKKHFGDEEAGKEGDWWKFSGM